MKLQFKKDIALKIEQVNSSVAKRKNDLITISEKNYTDWI